MSQGYFLKDGEDESLLDCTSPVEYMLLRQQRSNIVLIDHTPYGSFNRDMSATSQDKERIDIYEFYTPAS